MSTIGQAVTRTQPPPVLFEITDERLWAAGGNSAQLLTKKEVGRAFYSLRAELHYRPSYAASTCLFRWLRENVYQSECDDRFVSVTYNPATNAYDYEVVKSAAMGIGVEEQIV